MMNSDALPPDPAALREKAERYRAMARGINDTQAERALLELAAYYDTAAEKLTQRSAPDGL